jgi:hypothetical protein
MKIFRNKALPPKPSTCDEMLVKFLSMQENASMNLGSVR